MFDPVVSSVENDEVEAMDDCLSDSVSFFVQELSANFLINKSSEILSFLFEIISLFLSEKEFFNDDEDLIVSTGISSSSQTKSSSPSHKSSSISSDLTTGESLTLLIVDFRVQPVYCVVG